MHTNVSTEFELNRAYDEYLRRLNLASDDFMRHVLVEHMHRITNSMMALANGDGDEIAIWTCRNCGNAEPTTAGRFALYACQRCRCAQPVE
jgi:hypothetical protein